MPKIVPNQLPYSLPPGSPCRVALIGEAPGQDEERVGLPFIGAAGRELDVWLRGLFIRSQCFVGNLSQERPPANRLADWYTDKYCTQPNERLAGWINVLAEQLASIRPNIVVALGAHALQALTGKQGITDYWGSVLPCTLVPGLKVIALAHPSFVIRGLFDLRPIMRLFMRRALRQSEFPDYRLTHRTLIVNPSIEQVHYELDRLMSASELAFDIETIPKTKYQVPSAAGIFLPDIMTCISFSDSPDWSISVPFSVGHGQHRWTAQVEKEIWQKVIALLGQRGPLKIAHNLMFDFLELAGRRIFVAPPYYDTLVAHQRANLDLSKKKLKKLKLNRLAMCTALYTEQTFYKNDHKDSNDGDDWKGWGSVNDEFWRYNAMDSAVLHEIKASTWADLTEAGMSEMFLAEMEAFSPLAAMGIQGVLRDTTLLNERYTANDREWAGISEFVTAEIDRLQAELNAAVGCDINTKSSQQMQRFLYGELGLPVQKNRKTHKPTADESAIAALYQKTKNPILKNIITLTRLRGFRSNYLDAPVGPDNRSRTTYNQARVSTARVSSSDAIIGTGKNLQTIPARPRTGEDVYNRLIKDYKRTFIADPGKLMFRRDYKQAEAMVVAWLAEDLQQISDFQSGADIHCRTVQILYDCDYQAAVDGYRNKEPEWILKRNLGKPVRHGFNYKLGEQGLRRQFIMMDMDVPTKECKRLLQAMASNVPAVGRWQAEVEETVLCTRRLVNPFGLSRTFLGIIDADVIREATAFVPQSTVGQMLNFALRRIYQQAEVMAEVDFLLQIHDAIICSCPTDQLQHWATTIGELMLTPLQIKGRELIIDTDCDYGPNWGDLKPAEWEK